jgi:hypothetical protein
MNQTVLSYAWKPNFYQRHRKKIKYQKREWYENNRIRQRRRFDQQIWNRIRQLSPSKIVIATEKIPFRNHRQLDIVSQLPRFFQKKIHRKFQDDYFYVLNPRQYQNLTKLTDITMSRLRFYSVLIPLIRQKKKLITHRDISTSIVESEKASTSRYRDVITSSAMYPLGNDIDNILPIPKQISRETEFIPFNVIHHHQTINGPSFRPKQIHDIVTRETSVVDETSLVRETVQDILSGVISAGNTLEVPMVPATIATLESPDLEVEAEAEVEVETAPIPLQENNMSESEISERRRNQTQLFILLMMLIRRRPSPVVRRPFSPTLSFFSVEESEDEEKEEEDLVSVVDITDSDNDDETLFIAPNEKLEILEGETLQVSNIITISGCLVIAGSLEIYQTVS